MPWRLWRYLVGEQLRVLLLTSTAALVVTSAGAAAFPLSEGVFGLEELARLLGLFCVVTMPYAVPTAACFGVATAVARVARDHEFIAASAAGIAPLTLLAPTMLCGLLVGAVTLAASQEISPRFAARAAALIAPDPGRLIAAKVNQGDGLRIGPVIVSAAAVSNRDLPRANLPPGATPVSELLLDRVMVLGLTDEHALRSDCVAAAARVSVFDHGGVRYAKLTAFDAAWSDGNIRGRAADFDLPPIPTPTADFRIENLHTAGLAETEQDLDRAPKVAAARAAIVDALAARAMQQRFAADLPTGVILRGTGVSGATELRLTGGSLQKQGRTVLTFASTPEHPIVVTWSTGGEIRRELRPASMAARVLPGAAGGEPRLAVQLTDVRVKLSGDVPVESGAKQLDFADLQPTHAVRAEIESLDAPTLLAAAGAAEVDASLVAAWQERRIATARSIVAERTFRWALAAAAVLNVVLAGMVGRWWHRAPVAVLSVAAMLPLIACIFWLDGARSLAHPLDLTADGIAAAMAAAPAALFLVIVVLYPRLRRA